MIGHLAWVLSINIELGTTFTLLISVKPHYLVPAQNCMMALAEIIQASTICLLLLVENQ
jgi:hypothetical protein